MSRPELDDRDVRLQTAYTSSVPWADVPADCVVVCCSDPRFEQQNEEFVQFLAFSQPHFIQVPSGVAVFTSLVAAAGFLHKGMGLLLRKAIDLTGVDTVICIGHENCGGYRAGNYEIVQALTRRLASKPIEDVQKDHLAKAGRTISRGLGSNIEVRAYFAEIARDGAGDQVSFSHVGTWRHGKRADSGV